MFFTLHASLSLGWNSTCLINFNSIFFFCLFVLYFLLIVLLIESNNDLFFFLLVNKMSLKFKVPGVFYSILMSFSGGVNCMKMSP